MGAPTTATPRKRAAAKKKPTATKAREELVVSDADLARMEEELEGQFRSDEGPIDSEGNIRPVEVGRAGKAGPELVHVFTLENVEYRVPKNPSPAIMLRFMRDLRDRRVGQDAAVERAMMAILGKNALDALAESDETTEDDVADVFTIMGHILFGALKRWRAMANPS